MAELPWGVHSLSYIIGANGCQTGLPGGRWVRAIPEPYFGTFSERFRVAWWVLTGRAYAIKWPEPGELEDATGIDRLNYYAQSRYELLRECQSEFRAIGALGLVETIETALTEAGRQALEARHEG